MLCMWGSRSIERNSMAMSASRQGTKWWQPYSCERWPPLPAASCHEHPGQRCDFLGSVGKTPVLPLNHTHNIDWGEESREGHSRLIGSLLSSPAGQRSICECTGVYEWVWTLGLDLCCLQILSDSNARHGVMAKGVSYELSRHIWWPLSNVTVLNFFGYLINFV